MIDSQIDPVTGLPISGDLGIIQQIPVGVQMFDWESYNATARMVRPPLYGDDFLPTVTNLQGQHPLTGSAQSVETDGAHRLKVDTGLSNGLAPFPYRHETLTDHWDIPTSDASFATTDNHPRYLLGFTLSIYTTLDTAVFIYTDTEFQGSGIHIVRYVTTSAPINDTVMLPIPWDVWANYDPASYSVDFRAYADHAGAKLVFGIMYVSNGDLP